MNMHVIPWSRYPLTSADKHNQPHTQLRSAMTLSSNICWGGKWKEKFLVKLRIPFSISSIDILMKSLTRQLRKKKTFNRRNIGQTLHSGYDKKQFKKGKYRKWICIFMNVEIKKECYSQSWFCMCIFTWNVAASSGFLPLNFCVPIASRQHVGNSIFQWEVKVENSPLINYFFSNYF